jgi:hypothetical protein
MFSSTGSKGPYLFAMRVVKYWNSLPEKIVTSKTLNTFKNRLDKNWEDQNFVYEDFKADIKLEGRDVDLSCVLALWG